MTATARTMLKDRESRNFVTTMASAGGRPSGPKKLEPDGVARDVNLVTPGIVGCWGRLCRVLAEVANGRPFLEDGVEAELARLDQTQVHERDNLSGSSYEPMPVEGIP